MDFVVCALCGRGDVVMATHNAHSWGYFDPSSVKWKVDNLQDCGFLHLLPEVVSPPAVAGALIGAWCGLSEGVSVGVAMGDLQCSIKAAKPEINNAVLNIGTASQLSIINPSSTTPPLPPSLNQVPYFHGSNLIVAASLTGGNAIAGLITFFSDFLKKLGISHISEDDLYKNVLEGAMTKADTTLRISPLFLGERHQPHVRGQISNVTFDNSTYGDVGFALMKGVVDNLTDMMPPAIMEHFKIEKIIGCGSILHKNDMLTQLIKDHFTNIDISLEVKPDDVIGAPFGAAVTMTEVI
jgi:sedoheptulokinase